MVTSVIFTTIALFA